LTLGGSLLLQADYEGPSSFIFCALSASGASAQNAGVRLSR